MGGLAAQLNSVSRIKGEIRKTDGQDSSEEVSIRSTGLLNTEYSLGNHFLPVVYDADLDFSVTE